jgi:hypothetical protein
LTRRFAVVFVRKAFLVFAAAAPTAAARTATATTTGPTAATSVGTITAATSAGTKTTGFFRASFVNFDVAAANGSAVESRDGFGGFFVIGHFDESEAASTAGFAIHDYPNAGDRAEGLEQFGEFAFGGLKCHVAYE